MRNKKKKNERTRILMVVNPKSGRRKPFLSTGKIAEMFDEHNMEVGVFFTSVEYNASYLVNQHGKRFDIIACCGGDGTISEIISGMMKKNVRKPLGYIPAGTTNDLARSLDMHTGLMKAAKTIVFGKPCPMDVGSFDDRFFIYIASFGAFTEVSYATPQKAKNIFGRLAYFFSAFRCMNRIRAYHVRVRSDTKNCEGDYIFGAVMNSKSVAGIFRLDDDEVDFSDGKYEVLLIKRPKRKTEVLRIMISMLRKDYSNPYISFFHASDIEITSEDELDWSVDGELCHGGKSVHIRNHPRAVSIIMKN